MSKANTSFGELNAILDRARRTSAGATPVSEEQLLALQHRWTTALSARLDDALERAGTEPLTDAVAAAWRALAADQPILRAVLDTHESDSPALDTALRRECQMLAMAAGLTEPDDRSEEPARIGRALRGLIRGGPIELVPASFGASAASVRA
jgi:hypothetical protein